MNINYLLTALLILFLLIGFWFLWSKKKGAPSSALKSTQEQAPELLSTETPIKSFTESTAIESELVTPHEVPTPLVIESKTLENYNPSIKISSKTELKILKKLVEFEKNKDFLKSEITLNFLADSFGTNTKYISEVIKKERNQSFNNYLNELRIKYLLKDLAKNPSLVNKKISVIAEKVGFASHSAFSTIFTQIVGESPSSYIKKLKNP